MGSGLDFVTKGYRASGARGGVGMARSLYLLYGRWLVRCAHSIAYSKTGEMGKKGNGRRETGGNEWESGRWGDEVYEGPCPYSFRG